MEETWVQNITSVKIPNNNPSNTRNIINRMADAIGKNVQSAGIKKKVNNNFSIMEGVGTSHIKSSWVFCGYWLQGSITRDGVGILWSSADASSCLFEWRGQNEALPESQYTFEVNAAWTSGLVNLVFSHQTGFLEWGHLLIYKTMVITDPFVPSARL